MKVPLRHTGGCPRPSDRGGAPPLPTEGLFVYVYVLIDDAIAAGTVAPRPGPAPGCSDAELLAIALVRHLLDRRIKAGFFAEVARDWAHLFPVLPHQSEANRRTVKHPSRIRGPDGWTGPKGLHARFGRHAAHSEWFYGFRLAIKTDLGSRIVRAWSIGETAQHVSGSAEYFLAAARGEADLERLDEVDAANARSLAENPEREPRVLADRFDRGGEDLVAYARQVDGDPIVTPFVGVEVPLSTLLGVELGEVLVHGFDIARAVGLPWHSGGTP